MDGRRVCRAGLVVMLAGLVFLPAPVVRADRNGGRVKIGLVESMFVDVPRPLVEVMLEPFGSLMRDHTGLDGEMLIAGDALQVGKRLEEERLALGVFHGFEFAWARQRYPHLRPLMVAVYKHRHIRVNLVVKDDCAAAEPADLKGKALALPRRSKEHCRLFLDRTCGECGGCEPKAFFNQVTRPPHIEAGLDDVCLGRVQAAVVDSVSLQSYADVKPAWAARLKVLKQSETFPAGVVAYREGALDEGTLRRFRDGMINANRSQRGREMMNIFKISAFEPVPADYEQTLADILRAYPAPAESAAPRTSRAE